WCGTIQWICPSPYRSHHGRKNWFLGMLTNGWRDC
ncbi:peptide chain release factor, partial [Escherichia coli]|nr:peptide chain release factor [Escherichia coli]